MSSSDFADHRSTPAPRLLLRCGVVVGALYLAVGVIQGLVRDGFDFRRHALSHLANGPGGWVQTANLAVSGLLVIGAAIGIARALRSRATGWLLGCYGASMIVASVFRPIRSTDFRPGLRSACRRP